MCIWCNYKYVIHIYIHIYIYICAWIKHSGQQLHVFCASFTMSDVPGYNIELKPVLTWVVSDAYAHTNKEPHWVPDVDHVPGHDGPFITLSKKQRGLARALGRDCSLWKPLEYVQACSLIAHLRDMEVDRHTAEYKRKADPMADPMANNVANNPVVSRLSDRLTACPTLLNITLPEVTTEDDVKLDALDIIVQSSARRGVCPSVHLTAELMDWLYRVGDTDLTHCWPPDTTGVAKKAKLLTMRKHYKDMQLPQLPGVLKYRRRGKSLSIVINYKNKDGKSTSHQRTLCNNLSTDREAICALLPSMIEHMQEHLAQNDAPPTMNDHKEKETEAEDAVMAQEENSMAMNSPGSSAEHAASEEDNMATR